MDDESDLKCLNLGFVTARWGWCWVFFPEQNGGRPQQKWYTKKNRMFFSSKKMQNTKNSMVQIFLVWFYYWNSCRMSRTICRCLLINDKFIIQNKLNVLLAWPGMPKLCLSSVSTKEVNNLKTGALKCKSTSFLVHLVETTSFWSFWLKNMFRKSPARHCYHLLRGDRFWEEWWPPNIRGNTSYVTIHVHCFIPQHYMANLLIPFFACPHQVTFAESSSMLLHEYSKSSHHSMPDKFWWPWATKKSLLLVVS